MHFGKRKRWQRDFTFLLQTLMLYIFWLLMSWSVDWQHLLTGAAVALFVNLFSRNFLLTAAEWPVIDPEDFYYGFLFLVVLMVEVFKSNLRVAYISLHPKLPISPGFIQYQTKLQTDLGRVIFANALTLTPGTLTVEIEDNLLTIHGITSQDLQGVTNHPIEKILLKIEEARR